LIAITGYFCALKDALSVIICITRIFVARNTLDAEWFEGTILIDEAILNADLNI
jgi:hypothetical protein